MGIINDTIDSFMNILTTIGISDIVDIFIMTIIVYNIIILVRNTRTMQILNIVLVFIIVYAVSIQFKLRATNFLLTSLLQVGLIVMVIAFQPEIRRIMEQFTSGRFLSLSSLRRKTTEELEIENMKKSLIAICDSTQSMSEKKIGSLIVLEKFSSLDEVKRTGTQINAAVVPELIETIFYNGTPLHDGALVISRTSIQAAGCVLPLSDDLELSKDMGTRHRAALGLSENSDAVIIVTSEETGTISLAKSGVIARKLDRQKLHTILTKEFIKPLEDIITKQNTKAVRGKDDAKEQ